MTDTMRDDLHTVLRYLSQQYLPLPVVEARRRLVAAVGEPPPLGGSNP